MFGSQNAYGGYNNNYGNSPYYPPPTNDSFWGNNNNNVNQPNHRMNHGNPDSVIANDSLYGLHNSYIDGSLKRIESGISDLCIDQSSNDYKYASLGSSKKNTWASIASQPSKCQPKSLKSKMAASGLTGSTSKHLPPTVTMDAMSWDSKNGPSSNSSSGGKTIPPPAVITTPSVPPPIVQPTVSPIEQSPSPPPVIPPQQNSAPAPPPTQRPVAPPMQVNYEHSWNGSNGNSSPSSSVANSEGSPWVPQAPTQVNNPMPRPSNNHNRGPMNDYGNGNYNQNKYSNQRSNHYNSNANNNNNYHKPNDNQSYSAKNSAHSSSLRDGNNSERESLDSSDNVQPYPVVEKLVGENDYNPKEFDLNPRNARFFVIKSYSEDDIHRSIKYSIWCSTEYGNKRLDTAFRQQEDKGPIFLFFSVNRSGHFCGIAQMMSHVDYNATAGVWSQDKWKGQFKVKWIYVKDVPNDELRHITLENNENKPVTYTRDTQEVPYEKGKKVLSIIHHFCHKTSIFDDFLHYELKQVEELNRKPDGPSPPPQQPSNSHYSKMNHNPSYNSGMPRDNHMPYRGSNYKQQPQQHRSFQDARDNRNDYRNEYRQDYRNDFRNERNDRNDYDRRDHRDRNFDHRGDYRDNRDNHMRDHPRDYRDYRDHRSGGMGGGGDQYPRDNYRDYHAPPPPPPPSQRDYPRERNDYGGRGGGGGGGPSEYRDYRDRMDHREPRNFHREDRHQSWRN